MYFVVNKTKQHVALPDLKISLGPRQAMDLDKIMSREEIGKSRHLKAAKANGHIEVRVNNKAEKKETTIIKETITPDMSKVKDDIIKEMKEELSSLKGNTKEGISKEELMEAMRELMTNMPQQIIIKEGTVDSSQEEKVEMDESLLADINARTVNKRVEDVELKSVSYKEEEQDSDLNIDELENLLG